MKLENVVFFEKLGIVKLIDFGFSNMFNFGKKLEIFCGLLVYFVFEIFFGDFYDVFVVGKLLKKFKILYELYSIFMLLYKVLIVREFGVWNWIIVCKGLFCIIYLK